MKSGINKFFGVCVALIIFGLEANGQANAIQTTINKLNSFQSFGYRSVYKQAELAGDTLVINHKDVFEPATADKLLGYRFSLDMIYKGMKLPATDIYNGHNLISLNPNDSTYQIKEAKTQDIQGTLVDRLNWLNSYAAKKAAKIVQVADTSVNGNTCTHLIANTRDTVVKGEHFYTRIHLLINKNLGVPERIIIRSRNADLGDAVSNYYTETAYSDYRFNQDHISADDQPVPPGFHPPKTHDMPLLAVGSAAPDWTLTTASGKKVSLTQLRGKVVVLDYFFIGCYGCMLSLKPLNVLHQKYQHQNVELLSVTERDNEKSVAAFRKNYNINYSIYTNGADMVKAYHVESFPTFYIIDTQGKIAGSIVGYSDDFENKISAMIDALAKRQ